MKSAFALLAVTLLGIGCGGEAPPPSSPNTVTPPADAPADAATPDKPEGAPSADKSTDKPSAKADDDGAWAGEAEAKNAKAPEGGGKTETRTMDVIAKVVKDNRQPVRDCFEKAKKDLPDLKGDMVIHFVIDPDGKVKKAELNVERSTLKAPPVVDCAIKVLQGIKFPPSSRGMDTSINYPYNLN